MIQNPFPTRAEVSDNAVLDGDATMLSSETVRLMRPVADAAERHIQPELDASAPDLGRSIPEVMEQVIPMMCRTLPIIKIVAITRSGFAARMIVVHRPGQPIMAISDAINNHPKIRFDIAGTTDIHSDMLFSCTSINHVGQVLEMLWRRGYLDATDMVLATGVVYLYPGNRMNCLQVNRIAEPVESLGWTATDGT